MGHLRRLSAMKRFAALVMVGVIATPLYAQQTHRVELDPVTVECTCPVAEADPICTEVRDRLDTVLDPNSQVLLQPPCGGWRAGGGYPGCASSLLVLRDYGTLGVHSGRSSQDSEADRVKRWYKRPAVWIGVGGGLLLGYLIADDDGDDYHDTFVTVHEGDTHKCKGRCK
jgi:hypothetical protein